MTRNLFIECPEELSLLENLSLDKSLPTIDTDAALQEIIDSLCGSTSFEHELTVLCHYMAYGEGLFEGVCLNPDDSERIYKTVEQIGKGLIEKIAPLNVYADEMPTFKFKKVYNEHDIHLTTDDVACP